VSLNWSVCIFMRVCVLCVGVCVGGGGLCMCAYLCVCVRVCEIVQEAGAAEATAAGGGAGGA